MKKIILLIILILCISSLAGCQCRHEWVEADCLTPKTCSKCGEMVGDALGHKNTSQENTYNIKHATVSIAEYCKDCNELVFRTNKTLTTFIQDEQFIFTPRQFLDRLLHIAKDIYPDCRYEIADSYGQLTGNLYWTDSDEPDYLISFYHSVASSVTVEEIDDRGIWCVSVGKYGTVEDLGTMIDPDTLYLFCQAWDPVCDDETYATIYMTKYASFMNAVEYNEFAGYDEFNGLLYEFMHVPISESITTEGVLIYATNWLNE